MANFFRVPATPDPSGRTVVLENNDYDRILQRAQTLSVQEKKEEEEQQKSHRNDRMEASNVRKREMQEHFGPPKIEDHSCPLTM